MAVPNPETELGRLRSATKSGLPPIVVLMGPSGYFRGKAFDLVRDAIPEAAEVRIVSGDQATDGCELEGLRDSGLFATSSWLMVRRGDTWLREQGSALESILPHMGAGCGLLLEVSKLDKRRKLSKALIGAGGSFEFRDLYPEPYNRNESPLSAELVRWVVARGKDHSLRLSQEAAYMIVSTVGQGPAELLAELERVRTRLDGHGGSITPDDLCGALTCGFESTQFKFADAMLSKDRRQAMRSLEAMFRRGVKGRDGKPRIDGAATFNIVLSWFYTSLAQAYEGRLLLDQGVALRDIPGRLGVRVFVDRLQDHVTRNSLEHLRRAILLLVECQREMRSPKVDPEWLLQRFVMRYFAQEAPVAAI